MHRTLSLNKETLTELTPRELGSVAGGAITPACPTFDDCRVPTDHCVSVFGCVGVSQLVDPCLTYRTLCA
ncbi:MAG TPA: class I lanthipeptide [Frankiaceae bacterium]|jgi:hypothetical protein|nr:class I lanthipeptide [Frankiaceae bacterium]